MSLDLKNNLSAVLYAVDDIRLEHRDVPPVGDRDVLLEMVCVGICGSDVHYWKHGRISDFVVTEPMILGHEASGIVRQVGREVTHLKEGKYVSTVAYTKSLWVGCWGTCIGDRVAIEPGIPCLRCSYCIHGRYNLCPKMKFCATPPYHGNLSRYYVQSADFCYKLPDHVSFEEAALLEPLSVGVHACKRGGVTVGKKVLILGSGPIGLVNVLTAVYLGAEMVLVTDLNPERLKVAAEFGAKTLQVPNNQSSEKFVECIRSCMGDLPDITIDAGGFEATIFSALKVTKSGGTVVLIGMGASVDPKIPIFEAIVREVDVRGCFRYCNDYPDALSMVASGKVNAKRLVTHKFKLEETIKAFETTLSGQGIKVMIYCQKQQ